MLNNSIFHSIKTKLIFLITIVITAISLFVYIYFPQQFKESQLLALKDKVNTLTEIASYSVGPAIYFDDLEATYEQISPLLENSKITYLVIHHKNDEIFYEYGLSEAIIKDYRNPEISAITEDHSVFRIKSPIKFESEIIGTLYMGYLLDDLNSKVDEMESNISLISFFIFIAGVFAVFYIGHIITKPLISMVDIVEKIRGGNLSIRANIMKNDEIGFLARSFNSMVDRIEDSNEEMETINKDLESRVIERTKELKASKEKAEALVRMKTEFLAQMSHEIRTPINSILSYAQLLKDETINIVPHDIRFSFDMINNGGRRLIRTVDLILNMSELQTGTYEMIIEKCDIVKLLEELVGEFQTAAKSKNLDLMFLNRLESDETTFDADIYTVTQIFANLIDNAIKYTIEGSIEVVAYRTKSGMISIDVQDTGIGISKKFQETLFEPFTQEEQGYTRKFDGNGLGMALVKEYCKLNNAGISVSSEKDKGSTFTVVFNNTRIKRKKELKRSIRKDLAEI
jgi:signal transduction histidine kinase